MDNATQAAKGEAREDARKTKLFAISIAVILILFSIAAVAIGPSLKQSKEAEELRVARQEYEEAIKSLHNAIDDYATKQGYDLQSYDPEIVERVYKDCESELPYMARNVDPDDPETTASQLRSAAESINNRIRYTYNYTCEAVDDTLSAPEISLGINPKTIFNIEEATMLNGYTADHVYGNKKSTVRIVEYADLQCPACASLQPYMDELRKEYGDKVAFVFRNYPISGHQNALSAAKAAEAAGKIDEDHYWIMLSNLFEKRSEWMSQRDPFETYLQIYKDSFPGESTKDFEVYYNANEGTVKITHDAATGQVAGLTGTPSLYLNGQLIDAANATTMQEYVEIIRQEIDDALEVGQIKDYSFKEVE